MRSDYRTMPALYWNAAVGDPSLLANKMKTVEAHNAFGTETTIDLLTFIVRNARVESLTVGSRESFEKMNEFLVATELHPIVDAVFPWSKATDAFRQLEAGRHFGKIVLSRE